MKNCLKYFICFLFAVLLCVSAFAADKCGDNVTYSFDVESGVLTISGQGPMYDYSSGNKEPAFDMYSELVKEIVIKPGVTTVGHKAFVDCDNLEKVVIGKDVEQIGRNAFYYLEELESVVFEGNALKVIEDQAFYLCKKLKSIALPDSVEVIEHMAFAASGLTEISLGDNIKSIDDTSFPNSSDLFFEEDGIKYLKTKNNNYYAVWKGLDDSADKIVIHDGVILIMPNSFSDYRNAKKITIPDTVKVIGEEAFYYCELVRSVSGAGGLVEIGPYAFYLCKSLGMFNIPASVRNIGKNAFSDCYSLRSLTFEPNTSLVIGEEAFQHCSALEKVTIPAGTTVIGAKAFYNCDALTTLSLPAWVELIDSEAFADCEKLVSISMAASVARYGSNVFQYCASTITEDGVVYLKVNGIAHYAVLDVSYNTPDTLNLHKDTRVIMQKALQSCSSKVLRVPYGVTYLGEEAFASSRSLETVYLPESLQYISKGAFYGCSSLKNIVIPESIMMIRANAFEYCSSLESIFIPRGVEEIYDHAFKDCNNLEEIHFPAVLCYIGENAFEGANKVFAECCKGTYAEEYCEEYGIPYTLYEGAIPNGNNIVMQIDSRYAHVFRGKPYQNWIPNDVAPLIINGRTMLPARFVSQSLGAVVEWFGEESKSTITKGETVIDIYMNRADAYVNGEKFTLDAPMAVYNDRALAPVRFIAENLGATVKWYPDTREAELIK